MRIPEKYPTLAQRSRVACTESAHRTVPGRAAESDDTRIYGRR